MAISKLPAIPEIEDAAELISLVANSKLYKERMEKLVGIYEQLKKESDKYNYLDGVANAEEEAQSRLAAAKAKEKEAAALLVDAQQQADEALSKAQQDILIANTQLATKRGHLDEIAKRADDRRMALDSAEDLLIKQDGEVRAARKAADELSATAAALKAEYEEKLSKLKALV